MRETPDIWEHANKSLAAVDAEFVRGGGRVTATLATLLTDFIGKEDQLKNNVTRVYVTSTDTFYLVKDKTQIGNLTTGWKLDTTDISGKADLPDGIAVVGTVVNPNGGNVINITGFEVIYKQKLIPIPDGTVTLADAPVAGQFTRRDAIYYDPATQTYSHVTGQGETTIPSPVIPAGTFRMVDVIRYLNGNPNNLLIVSPKITFISNGNTETIYADKYFDGQFFSNNDAVRFGQGIHTPGRVGYKINNKNLFVRSDRLQIINDPTANNGQAIVFPEGSLQGGDWFTYGPYALLENGPCTLVIGLKVDDNTSNASGLVIQIARNNDYGTAINYALLPAQFTAVNTWQYFQIPFTAIKGGVYEVRINPSSNSVALPANFTIDEAVICPFPLMPDSVSASKIITDDEHQFTTKEEIAAWNAKQDASGKDQPNGYPGLDANGKIATSELGWGNASPDHPDGDPDLLLHGDGTFSGINLQTQTYGILPAANGGVPIPAFNITGKSIKVNGAGTGWDVYTPASSDDAANALANAKAYADQVVSSAYKVVGTWDASQGTYPVATSGGAAIKSGNIFIISVTGTIAGVAYDQDDEIVALVDVPGQTAANWKSLEHNLQQASETVRGTAKTADQATVQNENTTEDGAYVSPKKFWMGLSRFAAVARTITASWNFTGGLLSGGNTVETQNNKDANGGYVGKTAGGNINATADQLPEKGTNPQNMYFTAARVLATAVTGLAAVSGSPVAADSILTVLSKFKGFYDTFSTQLATYLTGSTYLDQSGSKVYVDLTYDSANNRYSGNLTPAITSYPIGLTVTFHVSAANNLTEPGLSLNGLAYRTIKKANAAILEVGDLAPGFYTVVYNGSYFVVENSVLQFANTSEVTSGTNTTKVINPNTLAFWWNQLLANNAFDFKKAVTFESGITFAAFASLANQMVMFDSTGSLQAGPAIETGGFITDNDIIAAIVTAQNSGQFIAGNNFEVTIQPANNKIFKAGTWYNGGDYKYFAVADNTAWRIQGS